MWLLLHSRIKRQVRSYSDIICLVKGVPLEKKNPTTEEELENFSTLITEAATYASDMTLSIYYRMEYIPLCC